MGAGVFHGRVRDGIGCGNPAMATGPPGRILGWNWLCKIVQVCVARRGLVLRVGPVPFGRARSGDEPKSLSGD